MKTHTRYLYHLIPIVVCFAIISVFFAPLYSGKTLVQSDNVQLKGVNKEITEYKEKGEQIHWNPREFSGVPLLMSSQYNPFKVLNGVLFYGIFPKPVMMVFFLFLGFYLLLQVMGVDRWLSAIGAFAYAFSSFNIISVEVGHDNKVLAIAFMAPVLAGVVLAYRGWLLKGGVLTMLAAGFQLYFGHIQITYYLLIMVLGYLILVVVKCAKEKEWSLFLKASGTLAVATVIAFGCNFNKLYSTLEYADYSTRGGSDLKEAQGERASGDGLDKEYALSWSNGMLETFTLMFPYFHGGASGEQLSEKSETYEALSSRGVDARTIQGVTQNVPLYWGDQPFTGGPIYFGAIICFLFVLSMMVLEGPLKWWGLGLTILSLLLAMGKNLEWFTDIFFYYVPLYNKFRSVTMILSIAQLVVPLMALLALNRLLQSDARGNQTLQKQVLYAGGTIIGLGVFFIVFKGAFFDFVGSRDAAYGFPDWLVKAVQADRKRLFTSDIIRSIVFVALAGGSLWLYLKKTLALKYVFVGVGVLIVVDLWGVNKRYLGKDDFDTQRRMDQQVFNPSPANQQINQDEGYFRVLNLAAQNPFSDGITSYHHYSALGYSAIKMQRYQELIDKYIQSMNQNVLNMLNIKYIIGKSENGQERVQRNVDALGNAWLVEELTLVDGADAEYGALEGLDTRRKAVVDKSRFGGASANTYSGEGEVSLSSYHPEKMVYSFSSMEAQFVVFSEIYYAPGWKAYIDGAEVDHVRVNYILRGLEVPAGDHEIVFKYEPFSNSGGNWVIFISTLMMILMIGYQGVLYLKN